MSTQAPALQPQQQLVTAMAPTTTFYTASGTPVQIVNINPNEGNYQRYNAKAARISGITQIVLGILIFIVQIVVTVLKAFGYEGMVGIWAPVIMILAGAFGIQSSKTKSQCTVVTTLILSIIAAVFSIGPFAQGITGALSQRVEKCHSIYDDYTYLGRECEPRKEGQVACALFITMALLGFIEAVIAIIAAAICCRGCCCNSRQRITVAAGSQMPTTVHYTHNTGYMPAPVPTVGYPAFPGEAGSPPEYKEKEGF